MESVLLDVASHCRSPATMPGYHRGRPPRNKAEQYPADPPTVEEIVAVIRIVGDRSDGYRLRALIVLLWRAGLRISEALALLARPPPKSLRPSRLRDQEADSPGFHRRRDREPHWPPWKKRAVAGGAVQDAR
jgi:hypothetical protein